MKTAWQNLNTHLYGPNKGSVSEKLLGLSNGINAEAVNYFQESGLDKICDQNYELLKRMIIDKAKEKGIKFSEFAKRSQEMSKNVLKLPLMHTSQDKNINSSLIEFFDLKSLEKANSEGIEIKANHTHESDIDLGRHKFVYFFPGKAYTFNQDLEEHYILCVNSDMLNSDKTIVQHEELAAMFLNLQRREAQEFSHMINSSLSGKQWLKIVSGLLVLGEIDYEIVSNAEVMIYGSVTKDNYNTVIDVKSEGKSEFSQVSGHCNRGIINKQQMSNLHLSKADQIVAAGGIENYLKQLSSQ